MRRYLFFTVVLLYNSILFSQDSSKIYYEVFRNNNIYKSDSILVKKYVTQLNPFDLTINKYDIIHLKPGDSLWMYLLYPLDIIKYSSFHNSVFENPYLSIPEPPYLIEMNHTSGGSVIRDKFSDTLNYQDTLLYNLREFPNNFLYCFLVQFDEIENGIIEAHKSIFNIYPNPNNGHFYIKFNDSFINENYQFRIYNIQNQLVKESKGISANKNKIDLQELDNGVYYVEIYIQNQFFRQKIIKQ